MTRNSLTVSWISDYPLEWMADLPGPLRNLPRREPATWMPVLLRELEAIPELSLHVIVLRKTVTKDFSFERNGVVFHVLKVPGGFRAPSFFWTDTLRIRRALREIKPDLVHAWGTERGEAIIASRLRYPCLVTIQGLMTWYKELVPLDIHQRFAAFLEPFSLRRAHMATVEATFAVGYLRRKYPRLLVHQAEHAPSWLFHRVERRPQTDPVRFINVATAEPRKGTDLLLRALNRLSREFLFQLLIVGPLPSRLIDSLKPELSAEFWRRITFKTNLTPAEVANELGTATISVLPTRADTSPNAVKEAVVAGVPIVASRIGGIPDYVFPGRNGFLFPPDNPAEFLRVLRLAIEHPLFGNGSVEPCSLRTTREYLSPKRMAQQFLAAYRLAIERHHRGDARLIAQDRDAPG